MRVEYRNIKRARFSLFHPFYRRILWVIKPKAGKYFLAEKLITFPKLRIYTTYSWNENNEKYFNIILGGKYSLTLIKNIIKVKKKV